MAQFILILVFLLIGVVARRATRAERQRVRPLNLFILWVSLPAVVLTQLPAVFDSGAESTLQTLILAGTPWVIFVFTTLVTWIVGRRLGWQSRTIGAISLAAGLGNTSFVGFPLLQALIGDEAIKHAIVVDQPGTFLALSTVGIFVASFFSTRSVSLRASLVRMISFPPLIAVLVAFVWAVSRLPHPETLETILAAIGKTLAPFALLSVGWQLEFDLSHLKAKRRELLFGLGMKLFASPVLIWIFATATLGTASLARDIAILEAAMAPMITAAVVAQEMDLDGDLAQLLLSLGIPISLVTVPLWWWLLG